MRRKEYAVSLGLATAGKGRMSREALDAVAKAESEGRVFDDSVPVKSSVPAVPKTVAVTQKRPVSAQRQPVTSQSIMGDVVLAHPMDQLFKGDDEGKTVTVNAKQICRNSGYSICGCHCGGVHSVLSPKSMNIITVR